MNAPLRFAAPIIAALAIAACSSGGNSSIPSAGALGASQAPAGRDMMMPQWEAKGLAKPACPQVAGKPTCLALIQSKSGISPLVAGWAPADFQARYNTPSTTGGKGQTVAIVDAYDNPDVATDLAAYRSEFGLGTANFTKYNQNGQTSNYPSGSVGWGVEIALDVEMVSALCPNCKIDLVEANGSDSSDLEAAEVEAAKLAPIVSNSWICYGSNSCVNSSDFDTKGILYLAASGDAGYDENGNPESLSSVVSVGGTVLAKSGSNYSESVWVDAGGGCSNNGSGSGITKPSWQNDPDCKYRTDSDISAVAWEVAEYDTYGYGGWFTVGGTSVASPLSAAVFALAGNATSLNAAQQIWQLKPKKSKKDFHYISSGDDGSCGGEYLCQAGTKQFHDYAGPIGFGTPNGIKGY